MNIHIFKPHCIFIFLSIILFSIGCKSYTSPNKDELRARLNTAIEEDRYIFSAQSATPMSYKLINLSYGYYLKVSKDTIKAYLPYYGRSHSAPIDPNNIGITFTSTDFEYQKETLRDSWKVNIKIKDNPERSQLYLSISNSGYADLQVSETTRQSISYRGTIDVKNNQ